MNISIIIAIVLLVIAIFAITYTFSKYKDNSSLVLVISLYITSIIGMFMSFTLFKVEDKDDVISSKNKTDISSFTIMVICITMLISILFIRLYNPKVGFKSYKWIEIISLVIPILTLIISSILIWTGSIDNNDSTKRHNNTNMISWIIFSGVMINIILNFIIALLYRSNQPTSVTTTSTTTITTPKPPTITTPITTTTGFGRKRRRNGSKKRRRRSIKRKR